MNISPGCGFDGKKMLGNIVNFNVCQQLLDNHKRRFAQLKVKRLNCHNHINICEMFKVIFDISWRSRFIVIAEIYGRNVPAIRHNISD